MVGLGDIYDGNNIRGGESCFKLVVFTASSRRNIFHLKTGKNSLGNWFRLSTRKRLYGFFLCLDIVDVALEEDTVLVILVEITFAVDHSPVAMLNGNRNDLVRERWL